MKQCDFDKSKGYIAKTSLIRGMEIMGEEIAERIERGEKIDRKAINGILGEVKKKTDGILLLKK